MSIMQFTVLGSDIPVAINSDAIVGVRGGDLGSIVYVMGAAFAVNERYEDIMDVSSVEKLREDGTWKSDNHPTLAFPSDSVPDQFPVPHNRHAEAVEALRNITGMTGNATH